MNNLENAVSLSFEEWINSYSEDTEWAPSKSHNREIKRIISYAEKGKYRFTSLSRAVKIAIIAAIILLLSIITVFAIPQSRDLIIRYSSNNGNPLIAFSSDTWRKEIDEDLTIGYIPQNYNLINEYKDKTSRLYSYQYLDDKNNFFEVSKEVLESDLYSDIENYTVETIKIDNINYIYKYRGNYCGLYWNHNGYTYIVRGTLSKEEILNIAKSTK